MIFLYIMMRRNMKYIYFLSRFSMKKKDMSELAQIKVDLRNRTTMYENQKRRVLELSSLITKFKEEGDKKDELLQIQKETIIRQ